MKDAAVEAPLTTGAVVKLGAADPDVVLPSTDFAVAFTRVSVTAPVEAELLIIVPSPLIEITLAEDVLQVAQVMLPVDVLMTSGELAVTAGVPDEVPNVIVGDAAMDGTVITAPPLVVPLIVTAPVWPEVPRATAPFPE